MTLQKKVESVKLVMTKSNRFYNAELDNDTCPNIDT